MVEIVGVYTSKVVKMKEHLPFCREFRTFCIEEIVVADNRIV